MIILIIRKFFECVSVGIGSNKHSAYLYPFNYPLSSVILYETACLTIIILFENLS